ncbi:hypothetical protein LCGC14_1425130 [marine sediment metagenome]|uniref:Uncharacterized protein n=1 Tax=marine sediment metagenome TaxID=412755 RepID=A0A0F9KBB2_9ZZZZ
MAPAIFHGKGSAAVWEISTLAQVTEWSCTIIADTAESTVMHATSYGKTREVGFKGGTATVTCKLGGDLVITEGDTATLELWRISTTAGKGYTGQAICTGVDVGVDMNDIEVVTYSFQFTSTIANTLA